MKKTGDFFIRGIYILSALFFLPVLVCVIFAGNSMEYFAGMKLWTLLPNLLLMMIALAGGAACIGLFRRLRPELTRRRNLIINGILLVLFILLTLVNMRVAGEIAFGLPWDVMVIRDYAHVIAEGPIGYEYYYSMYPNNLPITYLLARLYRWVREVANYPYTYDFIWLQINCVLMSVGGFFCCLTVKRLTANVTATVLGFLLYVALVGISPWKIAPYTDTYGMVFPIICIYFYICFRQADQAWKKYLYFFLSLTGGMAGGYFKPSVYIIVIAVLGMELIRFLRNVREGWKLFWPGVLLTVFFAFSQGACTEYIIEGIGLVYNDELESSWHHYFLMGLNEETTGGYCADDIALFGKYSDSREERIREEWRLACERLKEKGVPGTIWFWLRKMVMTFNDGTFGWNCEVWIHERYPEELAGNTALTGALRDLFWPEGAGLRKYGTFCQLAWIFCQLGICGIFLCGKEEREKYAVLVLSFLGIFLYQMLFEARARYLFVFLPVLIVIWACGMQQLASRITAVCRKKRALA